MVQSIKVFAVVALFLVISAGHTVIGQRGAQSNAQRPQTSSNVSVESSATLEETEAWLKGTLASLRFGTFDVKGAAECVYFEFDPDRNQQWNTQLTFDYTAPSVPGNSAGHWLKIAKTHLNPDGGRDEYFLNINLSRMDPQSVGVRYLCAARANASNASVQDKTLIVKLDATSTEQNPAFGGVFLSHDYGSSYDPGHLLRDVFFVVSDKEMGERITQAFRHLIKLAGGKVAPF